MSKLTQEFGLDARMTVESADKMAFSSGYITHPSESNVDLHMNEKSASEQSGFRVAKSATGLPPMGCPHTAAHVSSARVHAKTERAFPVQTHTQAEPAHVLTRRQACKAIGALTLGGVAAVLSGCAEQDAGDGHLVTSAQPRELAVVNDTGAAAGTSSDGIQNAAQQSPAAGTLQVPEQGSATYTSASGATCIVRSADERRATSGSVNEEFPGRHVCFLTFDDGPSTNTQRILGILNDYGVRATWFVKGNCGSLEELPSIWEQGNQVAIHTYTHEYEQIYASAEAYWSDLHQCGDAIAAQIGHSPTLVRFPGGSVNDFNAGVRAQIIEEMNQSGYHYFDWNVSCGDGADHTADELVGYATGEADGCYSCCVLMHDSSAKDTTVEALPRIIQYFIDNGFEFDVLLSDTFGYHF